MTSSSVHNLGAWHWCLQAIWEMFWCSDVWGHRNYMIELLSLFHTTISANTFHQFFHDGNIPSSRSCISLPTIIISYVLLLILAPCAFHLHNLQQFHFHREISKTWSKYSWRYENIYVSHTEKMRLLFYSPWISTIFKFTMHNNTTLKSFVAFFTIG